MDKLYSNKYYKKYQILKKSLQYRDIYNIMDKYKYIFDDYDNFYFQMFDMNHKKNFIKNNIRFLDLCSSPSGFSRYIIKKNKNNSGIGISLSIKDGGIPSLLKSKRFKLFYEDINNNKINDILKDQSFDLIIQGCHDMTEDKNVYINDKYGEIKLWLNSFKIGIIHLNNDGIYLFKSSIKNINFFFNLLDFLANYFDDFDFVKSSYLHNIRSSFFVICKNRNKNTNMNLIDNLIKNPKILYDDIHLKNIINLDKYIDILINDVIKIQYKSIKRMSYLIKSMIDI